MPNDGIRLKIILIIEVRKLEFTDFNSHSQKKFVLLNLPYLFFFYIGNIFSRQVNSHTGGDFIDRSIVALSNISYLPSFRLNDLLIGIIFSAVIWFEVYNKKKNAKKFRQGREYESEM